MARKKNKNTIILAFLCPIILVFALFLSLKFDIFEKNAPVIDVNDVLHINTQNPIKFSISDAESGLKYIKITLKKDINDTGTIIEEQKLDAQKKIELQINLPKTSYKEKIDFYIMQVEARDKSLWNFLSGNSTHKEFTIMLDDKKPNISILSHSYEIEKGGAASVVFKASDTNLAEVFIENDKGKRFEVLPYVKKDYYAALVAWDIKDANFRAFIVAKDKAGNIEKQVVPFFKQNRKYKNSNINLKNDFLKGKIETLAKLYAPQGAELSPWENFKFVNEDLRLNNEELIHSMSMKVDEKALKDFHINLFLPLKNAMKVADFGDHRFYSYEGKFLSDSYHLGLDLASVARAPIYSNNAGRVVYVGENGIYGLSVIIYHGFGLYTLYAHCTSAEVREGDELKAGELIAYTGVSGLALGDHLHFGVLIQGIETRPQQWQDRNWIKNNISKILENGKKMILSEEK